MPLYVEYRIQNLAELIETAQHIHNQVEAAAGRPVHPSEILTDTAEFNCIDLCLISSRLTDGSEVYNLRIVPQVLDVCTAGESAINGVCGNPDCVCSPNKAPGE